jgi:hypothetical protein
MRGALSCCAVSGVIPVIAVRSAQVKSVDRILVSLEFSDMGEGIVELSHWKNAGRIPNVPKVDKQITPVLVGT